MRGDFAMPIQGYTLTDLARLRTVQANPGRTKPKVVERRVGLRMVRVIHKMTDSGATVLTKEYFARRGDHKDVTVYAQPVTGFGAIPGRRA